MPDQDTSTTIREAIEKANARIAPTGESPPLPEAEETDAAGDAEVPEASEASVIAGFVDEGDVAGGDFAEDAPGSPEGWASPETTKAFIADAQAAAAVALEALEEIEEAGIPTIDTDHELAAYWSGYRAGGDDPGWLLTLAELDRHLGSFFRPEEEEAYNALNREDFWGRWMLGYLDAAAGRVARPEKPRTPEEMDW